MGMHWTDMYIFIFVSLHLSAHIRIAPSGWKLPDFTTTTGYIFVRKLSAYMQIGKRPENPFFTQSVFMLFCIFFSKSGTTYVFVAKWIFVARKPKYKIMSLRFFRPFVIVRSFIATLFYEANYVPRLTREHSYNLWLFEWAKRCKCFSMT